jgi:hypothetical protein
MMIMKGSSDVVPNLAVRFVLRRRRAAPRTTILAEVWLQESANAINVRALLWLPEDNLRSIDVLIAIVLRRTR